MRFKVSNWHEHQHYKDRAPPWLKLHHTLLTEEYWVMCDDASRVLAIACMLLAGRDKALDGSFNADPEYVKRFAYLSKTPNYKPLIEYGFLEVVQDASILLAGCLQNAIPETETETETETQLTAEKPALDNGFEKLWTAYPKKIGKGAAETAFKKAKINGHLPEVLAALDRQKGSAQWTKDGGQYIPNPATWINQKRWLDEPDAQEQKQARDWI